MVIGDVKTTSHFLKVTPLTWASEGQNNESKSYKATQLIRGGGSDEVWQMTQVYNFFVVVEGFPYTILTAYLPFKKVKVKVLLCDII